MEQRLKAIRKANRVRVANAQLKRGLRAGHKTASTILTSELTRATQAMRLDDLLLSVPQIGQATMTKLLSGLYISPTSRLRELTERQREVLAERLENR